MPKSKRRKAPSRKPAPKRKIPFAKKLVVYPDGRQERRAYQVQPLSIDLEQCLAKGASNGGDFAVAIVPTALTVEWMRTSPASVCAQACIHLVDAYRLLGVEANIVPVTVTVAEGANMACYGEDPPRWDDTVYVGHCIVNLPGVGRFIDPTIQQFDGFQRRKYPYIGKTVFSSHDRRQLVTGDQLKVLTENRAMLYTVAQADEAFIADHPIAQKVRTENERAAANIAAQTIEVFRTFGLAGQLSGHQRIRTMLDVVGDAEFRVEPSAARFIIDGQPRWIDELLPESSTEASTESADSLTP